MDYVLVSDLMTMCGFSHSRAFYNKIKRKGLINLTFKVTHSTNGQKILAVRSDQIELFKEKCFKAAQCGRRKQQLTTDSNNEDDGNLGWFYAVQTMPTTNPKRVKLGFAGRNGQQSVDNRLAEYRTILGNDMILLAKYPCHHRWECGAIRALVANNALPISGATEVFDFHNIDILIKDMKHYFIDIMKVKT